jgi:hypothetical protein
MPRATKALPRRGRQIEGAHLNNVITRKDIEMSTYVLPQEPTLMVLGRRAAYRDTLWVCGTGCPHGPGLGFPLAVPCLRPLLRWRGLRRML